MNDTLLQIVEETVQLTGAVAPAMLDRSAPVLVDAALADDAENSLYLVGLIGGKDVGKSTMVNAVVGQAITEQTSHGPGTQLAIAYVHRNRAAELRSRLDNVAAGQYRMVEHGMDGLSRQVLLDLPDIDSHFAAHVQLTRKILRHTLYPIWVQSVEKYADARPQQLLAEVAAGNDLNNFIFCLNKTDQLGANLEEAAALRDDFAQRLAKTLKLPKAPQVYLVSAIHPDEFDFPRLLEKLRQEKSLATVRDSKVLAGKRRQATLLAWLVQQDLPGRAAAASRLYDEAAEVISQRVGVPLLESTIPRLLDNPAYRAAMTDGVLAQRAGRWPLVSAIHVLLVPLRFVLRSNATPSPLLGADALVDSALLDQRQSIAVSVQAAFAQLQQSHPSIAQHYSGQQLWETMDAQQSEAQLRQRLVETIARQRDAVTSRLGGKAGFIAPFFRGLLTYGALLWFPIIQPLLDAWLKNSGVLQTLHNIGVLAVQILSTESLLKNGIFLTLWFLAIWLWLRWNTRRRVDRLLNRWRSADQPDPSLNLSTATLEWLDDLLAPIRRRRDRLSSLAQHVANIVKS